MRVLYCGNHRPSWSTERHVSRALEENDCDVLRVQEEESVWRQIPDLCANVDLVLWTRTFSLDRDLRAQREALDQLQSHEIKTAAIHLDKFWDLARESQIRTEPWFRCQYVFTADGGNQDRFKSEGVNHFWSPPAVVKDECVVGVPRIHYLSDVAFVGNWRGEYHPEATHRAQLVAFLRANGCSFWPQREQIRGQQLSDLYASARVIVGDSCMVGGTGRYWSDRIPETLGRGGFLLHPFIDGLQEHFVDGVHLRLYPAGDFKVLRELIDYYLNHEEERREIAREGFHHVRSNHTYTNRMKAVLETIRQPEMSLA